MYINNFIIIHYRTRAVVDWGNLLEQAYKTGFGSSIGFILYTRDIIDMVEHRLQRTNKAIDRCLWRYCQTYCCFLDEQRFGYDSGRLCMKNNLICDCYSNLSSGDLVKYWFHNSNWTLIHIYNERFGIHLSWFSWYRC